MYPSNVIVQLPLFVLSERAQAKQDVNGKSDDQARDNDFDRGRSQWNHWIFDFSIEGR